MTTPAILGFDSQPRTRLVYGLGALDRIGELARDLGRSALVVTDPGIVKAGHVARVVEALGEAGIATTVFDSVRENPTTKDVDDCLAVAKASGIDLIVGLGGGSSIDTARGCNFLLTNGGQMKDYWGVGKATREMLPLIAVPTTAGTGSECQSFALIADEATHQKMACGDPKAAARIAILDPALTVSQPRGVTACTGVDAIAHAIETAVCRKRNALSFFYSREAFRLTVTNLPLVLENPENLEARAQMLLGAAFAGIAIENSMLGAAHSAANPLTAHFGVIHGQAVGMMLPHVVRFNAHDATTAEAYRELAVFAGLARPDEGTAVAVEKLVARLEEILARASMAASLADCGVTEESVPALAAEAASQWTANFNPRTIVASDFEMLYRNALHPSREGTLR